jgi:hypothetical protein
VIRMVGSVQAYNTWRGEHNHVYTVPVSAPPLRREISPKGGRQATEDGTLLRYRITSSTSPDSPTRHLCTTIDVSSTAAPTSPSLSDRRRRLCGGTVGGVVLREGQGCIGAVSRVFHALNHSRKPTCYVDGQVSDDRTHTCGWQVSARPSTRTNCSRIAMRPCASTDTDATPSTSDPKSSKRRAALFVPRFGRVDSSSYDEAQRKEREAGRRWKLMYLMAENAKAGYELRKFEELSGRIAMVRGAHTSLGYPSCHKGMLLSPSLVRTSVHPTRRGLQERRLASRLSHRDRRKNCLHIRIQSPEATCFVQRGFRPPGFVNYNGCPPPSRPDTPRAFSVADRVGSGRVPRAAGGPRRV